MSKSYLRIISIESKEMVYHSRGCQYARKMRNKNKIEVTKHEAEQMGYRPCKCCNSMNYRFQNENSMVEKYAKNNHMKLYYQKGIIYVKTEMGVWKIIYSKENQKFILYHANHQYSNLELEMADTAHYHRQKDEKYADTIMTYMIYIQKHDRYRKQVQEAGGDERAVKLNKKYAAQRKRRMRRQSYRRLEHIFAELEKENSGYAKLACY